MTAKERLISISHNLDYIEQLRKRRETMSNYGLKAVNYSAPRVQQSFDESPTERAAERNIKRLQAIDDKIMDLLTENETILDEIHQCDGGKFSRILYAKYFEGKSLMEISIDLGYEYKYLCTLHNKALKIYEEYCKENEV